VAKANSPHPANRAPEKERMTLRQQALGQC
jgi:hypothetical protein